MHELSLVQNILEIVRQNIPVGSENDLQAIHVRIGIAAGIVSESLEFCFSTLVQHTPFEKTTLIIQTVPLTLQCNTCHLTRTRDDLYFICPACGSNLVNVLSGTELEIAEIELCEHDRSI